ncbi:hypothetical protein MUN89_02320 [Halobacillus salinarum]|uniref:Uncharacterized protein n=1 Tax=Halobacillus salinarum TaxID=2932257 RepID=A0ABY4ELE9_9BACI|nr:hypothetical protein [Halobacillus salinarum]UOQ44810.1 hypothetical protein MUN89_02320 [Halobacillus salinarum]
MKTLNHTLMASVFYFLTAFIWGAEYFNTQTSHQDIFAVLYLVHMSAAAMFYFKYMKSRKVQTQNASQVH